MPNPGPCFDKFLDLEDARRASDDCWDGTWGDQMKIAFKASVAALGCVGAVSSPDPLTKERCAASAAFVLVEIADFWKGLDRCNELDLAGEQAAKDWLACYQAHKAVLDERLVPRS